MSEYRDDLTPKQGRVLRSLIRRTINRKCYCSDAITCGRCREIAEIREHFPENWLYAADINAQMGPQK